MRPRRPRSLTPEDRAARLSESGYMASGYTYIAVVMRDTREQGKVPYYSDPAKCDHGFSMCPTWECIESWSMDYQVLLPNTHAGRVLAAELGIDPIKFALADHVGLEMLRIADFKV